MVLEKEGQDNNKHWPGVLALPSTCTHHFTGPCHRSETLEVPAASQPVSLRGAFACVNSVRWSLPPTGAAGAARRRTGLLPLPLKHT